MLRLLKGRDRYLSVHNFDDMIGIGADSIRLFVLSEGQIESEDNETGEKLPRIASAKQRAEKEELLTCQKVQGELAELTISPELARRQMVTAAKSLAFDLILAIDEYRRKPLSRASTSRVSELEPIVI